MEKFMSSNSILPVLGMAQQYFDKKAKQRVISDLATKFQNEIAGIENPIDLETKTQKMITEIYSSDLDPQEQATTLNMLNQFRGTQEKKILNQTTKKIDALDYDAESGKIYAQQYEVDTLGNQKLLGERFEVDEASLDKLTVQGVEQFSKFKEEFTTNERELKEQKERDDRTHNQALERGKKQVDYSVAKSQEIENRKNREALNKAKQGKRVRIVDPKDPTQTIYAQYKPIFDESLTDEEQLQQYMSNTTQYGYFNDKGESLGQVYAKVDIDRLTQLQRVDIGNTIKGWYDQAEGNFLESDTELVSWLKDNKKEIANILDQGSKEDFSGKTISVGQIAEKNINQNLIDNIVEAYNKLNNPNDEDTQLILELERTIGQPLIKRDEIKQVNQEASNRFIEALSQFSQGGNK